MSNSRKLYPSISALCAFEAVARTLSFTHAAEELSLTQSAVSRQIRSLESQLNCVLIVRNTRITALSPAGREYLSKISPALTEIRNASLNALSKDQQRFATIALLPTFGTRWLMPRIPKFLQKYPDVTINFITRIGKFDFYNDDIDGAIYHGLNNWEDVDLTLLKRENLIPVASRDFLENHPVQSPNDLINLPKLRMKSRPNDWRHWFETQNLNSTQNSGMIFEQFSLVTQACMAGVGIALMPEFLIEPELQNGNLIKIGDSVQNDSAYYYGVPKIGIQNSVALDFKNWILEEASEL